MRATEFRQQAGGVLPLGFRMRRAALRDLRSVNHGMQSSTVRTPRSRTSDATSRARVGLVAGWGRYPIVVAQTLADQGVQVICQGIRGHADPALAEICHHFEWVGLGQLGAVIRRFRRHGVSEAMMAGKVHKVLLYRRWAWWHHLPDWRGLLAFWPHLVTRRKTLQDDRLLGTIVDAFARPASRCGRPLISRRSCW